VAALAGTPPSNATGLDSVAPRYTVGSVAKATRLLDLVSDAPLDGLTVTELARGLQTSKSTAFALARTLADRGYLRPVDPGPRYQLGLTLVRLGDVAANQQPLRQLCQPILHNLSTSTALTTRVAINDGGQPVFIERVDAPGTIRFHTPLGIPELAHVSSAGKAILSTFTDEQVKEFVTVHEMVRRTPKTIVTLEDLLADLTITRRRNYAVDDEEDVEGVFCIGAAFFDHTGTCAGAVSATGIKRDLAPREVDDIGRAVAAAAGQVTALLRGTPPPATDPR
jgi:IclR family acetate operon transcriptional repressor